jgi:ATP-dependent DNA ligase
VTTRIDSLPTRKAVFIEPMECALVSKLADGPQWVYEIKLDGYRAVAVNSEGKLDLFSKRGKSFNRQLASIVEALRDLPENTVIDGEVVALDESGRPDFNMLQNFRGAASHIHYFVFDLLAYKTRDLTRVPLTERRGIMRSVLQFRSPQIRLSDYFETSATDMLHAVREQHLEGVVAKRKDSVYEPGSRTGAWVKYRVNRGQELVIGGYIPGPNGVDSIIVGYYRAKDLIYVARVRSGLVPASRRQLFRKLQTLVTSKCPFVNLPETHRSRWGEGLTGAADATENYWGCPGGPGANGCSSTSGKVVITSPWLENRVTNDDSH